MRSTLLSLILCPLLTSCLPVRNAEIYIPGAFEHIAEQSMWEMYGKNIEYIEYDEFDNITLSPTSLPVPRDLCWSAVDTGVRNRDDLENILLPKVNEKNHTFENTSTFKETVEACLHIVSDLLEYELVDDEKSDFAKKHGINLPLERYLEEKRGDCDKYTSAFIEVFNHMRENNPSLTNVHVFNYKIGGYNIRHDWVSFVILHKEKVQIGYLDPTLYDTTGEQRIERGMHIPATDEELITRVYSHLDPQELSGFWLTTTVAP